MGELTTRVFRYLCRTVGPGRVFSSSIGSEGSWNNAVRGGILDFMTDVTQILSQIEGGDPSAAEQAKELETQLRREAEDNAKKANSSC